MEDKHPITFSLSQFIILLAVSIVVMALVFILGARLGGQIFPEFYAAQFRSQIPLAGLAPQVPGGRVIEAPPRSDQLVDTLEEPGAEGPGKGEKELGEDAPHVKVGPNGQDEAADQEQWNKVAKDYDVLTVNKSLIRNDIDKDTVVRFKSSGNSKFTVEVADFFDELVASQKVSSLKKQGYEAYLYIKNAGSSSQAYSVRMGVFSDRRLAEEYAAQMATKQNLELRVVEMN
jgi:sporulation related protein